MLCYEEHDQFCHRHIVAAWFELLLDVKVAEIRVVESLIEELSRPEDIKLYLKDVMEKDKENLLKNKKLIRLKDKY